MIRFKWGSLKLMTIGHRVNWYPLIFCYLNAKAAKSTLMEEMQNGIDGITLITAKSR